MTGLTWLEFATGTLILVPIGLAVARARRRRFVQRVERAWERVAK